MTKVEILTNRQYLNIADLQKIFDCSHTTAERLMRQIKAKSDIANIKGKITVTDYEVWYNFNKSKESEQCTENA